MLYMFLLVRPIRRPPPPTPTPGMREGVSNCDRSLSIMRTGTKCILLQIFCNIELVRIFMSRHDLKLILLHWWGVQCCIAHPTSKKPQCCDGTLPMSLSQNEVRVGCGSLNVPRPHSSLCLPSVGAVVAVGDLGLPKRAYFIPGYAIQHKSFSGEYR
jgi:hypothetical protein